MTTQQITDWMTAGDIDTVRLTGCPGFITTVALRLEGAEIFRDTYTPAPDGTLTIHGLGSIIMHRAPGSGSPAATVSLIIVSTRILFNLTFNIILSPLPVGKAFPVEHRFLNTAHATILPAGEQFTITAAGDTPQAITVTKPGGETEQTAGTSAGPLATAYTYTPARTGIHTLALGHRRHNLIVIPAAHAGWHRLKYTNAFGAPEQLWIRAALTRKPQRCASLATVGGTHTEYDIRVTHDIELHAQAIHPVIMPALLMLPYARDITIDGNSVAVEELKPEHSPESGDLAELKISARILTPTIGIDPAATRIFRTPYKEQFT